MSARPSDPRLISFDARCFVQDGVEVHYLVTQSALHSGPARFDDESDAAEYARKTGRVATRVESPKMRRIAWTLAEVA